MVTPLNILPLNDNIGTTAVNTETGHIIDHFNRGFHQRLSCQHYYFPNTMTFGIHLLAVLLFRCSN